MRSSGTRRSASSRSTGGSGRSAASLAAAEGARRAGLRAARSALRIARAEAALAGIEPVPLHAPRGGGRRISGASATRRRGEASPNGARAGADAPDLADVRGQERARRALELAAAGGHNLLLGGPPGTGKTMLARRLPGILPRARRRTRRSRSRGSTRSRACSRRAGRSCATPPFRAPHHTASTAAIVGGGPSPRPGEASLAHRGVLFLDELAEFPRQRSRRCASRSRTGRSRRPRRRARRLPGAVPVRRDDEPLPVRRARRSGAPSARARRSGSPRSATSSRARCSTVSTSS